MLVNLTKKLIKKVKFIIILTNNNSVRMSVQIEKHTEKSLVSFAWLVVTSTYWKRFGEFASPWRLIGAGTAGSGHCRSNGMRPKVWAKAVGADQSCLALSWRSRQLLSRRKLSQLSWKLLTRNRFRTGLSYTRGPSWLDQVVPKICWLVHSFWFSTHLIWSHCW